MKYYDVLKAVQEEGAMARLPHWEKGRVIKLMYWEISGDTFFTMDEVPFVALVNYGYMGKVGPFYPHPCDLMRDDWEVM